MTGTQDAAAATKIVTAYVRQAEAETRAHAKRLGVTPAVRRRLLSDLTKGGA
jgi:hypothetical protein